MPFLFSHSIFRLSCQFKGLPVAAVYDLALPKLALAWAQSLSTDHTKHLRRVEVEVEVKYRANSRKEYMSLEFSPTEGLMIDGVVPNDPQHQYRGMLQAYGRSMERIRKVLGLQGEAMILALTSSDDVRREIRKRR